jgi:hypothetical protein
MPTPKPNPPHGALGEPPPDDAPKPDQAMSPPDYEADDDTSGTDDELPDSVSPSGADDNS